VDWDFVAVSGFLFFVVGVLTTRPVRQEAAYPGWALGVAAGVCVAVASLVLPWLAVRKTDDATAAIGRLDYANAAADARSARSLNPLALEPLFVEAAAAEQLGDLGAARDLYVKAVDLQPLNWSAWYELGAFWVSVKNHEAAVAPLERAVELDPHGTLAPALLKQVRSR
jgi:Flp pilus assembly protein TadD